MKGLLVKDFYLFKNQLKFYVIVGVIGMMVMFTQMNTFFVISYVTFIFSMFTLSTISYDEFDNGTAFLFTLPINKSTYVTEKYIFGALISLSSWGVTMIISGIFTIIKQPQTDIVEWFLTTIIFIFLPMMFLAVTLPAVLKFGTEKGRTAMFAIGGGVVVIVFIIGYVLKSIGIDIGKLMNGLNTLRLSTFIGIVVVVCSFIYIISYYISLKIMDKKQF